MRRPEGVAKPGRGRDSNARGPPRPPEETAARLRWAPARFQRRKAFLGPAPSPASGLWEWSRDRKEAEPRPRQEQAS